MKRSVKPNKSLGQHFLTDKNVLRKIIEASDLKNRDIILEIGPGQGVLTRELAPRVKKVIAVEIDHALAEIAEQEVKDFKNVEIITADILKFDLLALPDAFKVVSNLPYQITSPILWKFLSETPKPGSMYMTIQREVAKRIVAKPPDANLLGNMVQLYAEPKILFHISRNSFWPVPDVDSSFIAIENIKSVDFDFRMMKTAFQNKRKQIKNSLPVEILAAAKIDPIRRPETLTLPEWLKIYETIGLTQE